MTVPTWPIWVTDVLGSLALVALAWLAFDRALAIARGSESVVYTYLVWFAGTIGVVGLSRSVSHLVQYLLLVWGFEGVWAMLAPWTGAINTISFVAVAVLTLFYGRVVDQNDRLQREIEQRREAELALRRHRDRLEDEVDRRTASLRKFREAVENAGHAIFVTDADGTIEYANPAFEEITGFDATTAVGSTPEELGHVGVDGETDPLATVAETGDRWRGEPDLRTADGATYPAFMTVAPIVEDGTVTAMVGVQTDLTDRRALKRDLAVRNRQLSVLGRVFRHDLRNAINVIQGYAETIRDDESGRVASRADRIVARSERLERLAEKERTITAILANPRDPVRIDVGALVEECVRSAADRYPDAEFDTAIEGETAGRAIPDLVVAVEELLENAVEHAEGPRPTVRVRVRSADDRVAIDVADEGSGIAEMERVALTEGADVDQLHHASGLGLWIVHHVVEQSAGAVEIEEREAGGSVVTIAVPRGDRSGIESG